MSYQFKVVRFAAVVLAVFVVSNIALDAAPLSGTRTIGPNGDYHSITAAIADVQARTLDGPLILELAPNYSNSLETYPITFSNLTTTATNTLTLRPQTGATNLYLFSPVTPASLDFNGAQFVTIDGRPGGIGSNNGSGVGAASQLTIDNTITSGRALRFINDASNNTIRYTTLRGVNSSSIGGVVMFGNTTGANGNDNNTIDHCDIRDGAYNPLIGIYAAGSAAPKDNNGNTISNCNIYNFHSLSGNQYGVLLQGGNTGWTIIGNSFYQTAALPGPGGTAGAIYINNTAGNNFVVSSNYIGGSGPSTSGVWMPSSARASQFQGIALNVGSVTPSSVQGNIIQNFNWLTTLNSAKAPGIWNAITALAGSVDIGTQIGNQIGFTYVGTSGSGAIVTGISSMGTGTFTIANNSISSITVEGTTTSANVSITGIHADAGTNIIRNNIVGSASENVLNSLNASSAPPVAGVGPQQVTGIANVSSYALITGNLVSGLNNNYTNIFTGQVRGIVTSGGVNTIVGNTVRNMSTKSTDANGDTSSAVLGISATSPFVGQTVSQNIVYSLGATTLTGPVVVIGILYSGATNGVNMVERNFVHGLSISSTSTNSILSGLSFRLGSFTARNNMVRVGLAANGASTARYSWLMGIENAASTPGRNFYHNTVYVGGTQTVSSPYFTAAFFNGSSSNDRALHNNIFVNSRNKNGGTSDPCAIIVTGTSLTGFSANGNLYLANGTGGLLGRAGTNFCSTLAEWQAATGQDASSIEADPLLINPTGNSTTLNLHVSSNSPAIAAGVPIGVANDFDDDTRDSANPTIGADESIADYTLVPGYNQLTAFISIDGANYVRFQGMPATNYVLEIATNLAPPVFWQSQWTNSAAANGRVAFTNTAILPEMFFRVRQAP